MQDSIPVASATTVSQLPQSQFNSEKNQILLAAAEACLEQGWAIIPLEENGKAPFAVALNPQGFVRRVHNGVRSVISASFGPPRTYLTKAGTEKLTTAALQAWWDGLECNIGIALYLSDLTVLDIDEGIDSEDELLDFLKEFNLPITRCVKSGRVSSFGCHLYYIGKMMSGSFSIPWRGKTVKGEVKSKDKYVVSEGSFHKSGQQYRRLWDMPPATTPRDLFHDILTNHPLVKAKAQEPVTPAPFDGQAVTPEQFETWAEKYGEDMIDAGFNLQKNARMFLRVQGCPWKDAHTTPSNDDTDFAVFVGAGPLSVKCVHESCKSAWTETSGWKSYRAWLKKTTGKDIPLQEFGRAYVSELVPLGKGVLPNGSSASGGDMPEAQTTNATEPTDDDVKSIFHSESDYDNVKPVTFAISGFLQEDAVTFIGGLSGHSKTLILLAMAKALLEGTPLFGHAPFSVPTAATRVVYLIPESTLSPFKERMKIFGLEKFFRAGKFLFRTLSCDEDVDLTDPRILKATKGAHVFLDTAVRFMDGEEVVDSKRFAETVFRILKSGARSVTAAHHSAKAFEKQTYMSLENILRGSGDLGALCATCWGVKQVDEKLNQVLVKNCKPRDFQPCEPFVIQGRPFIDDTGTFQIVAVDVCFDGKNHVFQSLMITQEMQAVLDTYTPDKQAKLLSALSGRQKHTPKTVIAEQLGVSDTTVHNWLNDFDEKVKAEQKKESL
jgi:Bifunctional DNA primase/polymerase, N-terminal/AAA domain